MARKASPIEAAAVAATQIQLGLTFPSAKRADLEDTNALWLPDHNDIPILGLAIKSSADGLITLNAKDFPRGILAEHGLHRNDPDTLLAGFLSAGHDGFETALEHEIQSILLDFPDQNSFRLLRKAGLWKLSGYFR